MHEAYDVNAEFAEKSAEKSAEYRKEGNELFQKKQFWEAMEKFNLSLMFAPFPPPKTNKSDTKPEDPGISNNTDSEKNGIQDQGSTNSDETSSEKSATEGKPRETRTYKDIKAARKARKIAARGKRPRKNSKSMDKRSSECDAAIEDNKANKHEDNPKDMENSDPLASSTEKNNETSKSPETVKEDKLKYEFTMSYVVANRSASLFFLKLYEDCIEDIDLAFSLGYPDDLAYKLHERKAKCLVQMGRHAEAIACFEVATTFLDKSKLEGKSKANALMSLAKQAQDANRVADIDCDRHQFKARSPLDDLPELSYEKSEKFSCTIQAFTNAQSEEKGRHIIADADISVGDIISKEGPYASILYPEYYTTHCNNCLIRIVRAIPCRQCSRVTYCSQTCEDKAWKRFHRVECPCLTWLDPTWVGRLGHLALRIVSIVGYGNLKNYYCNDSEEANKLRSSPFNADGTYSSGYNAIYHLVANESARKPENIFNFAMISIILMKVLFECMRLVMLESAKERGNNEMVAALECQLSPIEKKVGPTAYQLEMLGTALIHHLQVIQCNAFAIPEMQGTDDFRTFVPRDIGLGIYGIHGLLNHSCNPGVDLIFYGDKMVGRAVCDIKKGEEICIDYGVTYFTHPKPIRKDTLKTQYYFDCLCEACQGDWPLWQEIECVRPTFRCMNQDCRKALVDVGGPLPTHIVCQCGQETPVMKNLNDLNASHQRYAIAMNLKAQTDNASVLKALMEHASLMQKYICSPWRDYVSCQSSIKQSFRLMGNWHRMQEVPPGHPLATMPDLSEAPDIHMQKGPDLKENQASMADNDKMPHATTEEINDGDNQYVSNVSNIGEMPRATIEEITSDDDDVSKIEIQETPTETTPFQKNVVKTKSKEITKAELQEIATAKVPTATIEVLPAAVEISNINENAKATKKNRKKKKGKAVDNVPKMCIPVEQMEKMEGVPTTLELD